MVNGRRKSVGKSGISGVDPQAAREKYNEFVQGGPTTGYRLKDLLNSFNAIKRTSLSLEEVSEQTYNAYVKVLDQIAESIGKHRPLASLTVRDFDKLRGDLATGIGLVTLQNRLIVARMVFRHATELGYRDLQFQRALKRPAARLLRKARSERPKKLFGRDEIHALLDAADDRCVLSILLGMNCGFGIADAVNLPIYAVYADVLSFPRQNPVERRCPLWPERAYA